MLLVSSGRPAEPEPKRGRCSAGPAFFLHKIYFPDRPRQPATTENKPCQPYKEGKNPSLSHPGINSQLIASGLLGAPRRARAQARAMLRGAGQISSGSFSGNPYPEPATLNFMPPAALNWKEKTLAIASGILELSLCKAFAEPFTREQATSPEGASRGTRLGARLD